MPIPHYHSTCRGCLIDQEWALYVATRGTYQRPGGHAFETEAEAQAHADSENAEPYMQGWQGHHQEVVPCEGTVCLSRKKA